ncbi:MAG: YSIRK-type signal peptide-containing protein, partial [Aerococcaceae bacterium]|nr:YSIRK-type signal peptide-containing protein [Aerococcaceae bacterium]
MKELQRRYSLRKYKGIGLASVAIATVSFMLSTNAVQAQELTASETEAAVTTTNLFENAPEVASELSEETVLAEEVALTEEAPSVEEIDLTEETAL